MMEPPQTCEDTPSITHCKLTMKGNSPGNAFTPPTIDGDISEAGAENTTAKANDKSTKVLIFDFTLKKN